MKAPEHKPILDGFHAWRRAVVFHIDQAYEIFSPSSGNAPSSVLCIDESVCKWVETLAEANTFYYPPTRYECDVEGCTYVVIDSAENKDLVICKDHGDLMLGKNIRQYQKRLAKMLAGEL